MYPTSKRNSVPWVLPSECSLPVSAQVFVEVSLPFLGSNLDQLDVTMPVFKRSYSTA